MCVNFCGHTVRESIYCVYDICILRYFLRSRGLFVIHAHGCYGSVVHNWFGILCWRLFMDKLNIVSFSLTFIKDAVQMRKLYS